MSETAQELRDQAAELLKKSVALDRKAAADRAAADGPDPLRDFSRALFAKVEDE